MNPHADMCDQSWVLFIADPCSTAWMDDSLFIHSLADGTFGVSPVQGHEKTASNILVHAFCGHVPSFLLLSHRVDLNLNRQN